MIKQRREMYVIFTIELATFKRHSHFVLSKCLRNARFTIFLLFKKHFLTLDTIDDISNDRV